MSVTGISAYTGMLKMAACIAPEKTLPQEVAPSVNRDSGKQKLNIDRVELSQESATLRTEQKQQEIKTEIPRSWTISLETLKSRIDHIDTIVSEANKLGLKDGERMYFLDKRAEDWVETIYQNDREMFVEWLKMNKEQIQAGNPELASLPSDFTMDDYDKYVHSQEENE